MRKSLQAIVLLALSLSALALSDAIQRDPYTNFPCLGYLSNAKVFFNFKDIGITSDELKIDKFSYQGEEYTGVAKLNVCSFKSFTYSDVDCPTLDGEKALGFVKLTKVDKPDVKVCIPIKAKDSSSATIQG